MNWEDECYLLSKRKFKENANIINVFSKKRGKVSGVVYGGNSRKIKNYLQISNKLYINHNAKNENRLGYFKTELVKPISPLYFNDKERSSALLSISSILNILLPDSQPNQNIYKSLEEFVNSIKLDNWIILYVYDPNLEKFKSNISESDFQKIKIDTFTYDAPSYLIQNKIPDNFSNNLIKTSLNFTRNIIQNRFFLPNKLPFPKPRLLLESYYS